MPLHILTYHRIDDARGPTSVAAPTFARQLAELAGAGFDVLPLSEALDRFHTAPERRVAALTFDDGYGSVGARAAPLLAERGWRATVFVVGGRVGGDDRWPGQRSDVPPGTLMSWEDLGALAGEGWEIGAHGETHADLAAVSGDDLARELAVRERIEEALGVPVTALAYPNGSYDEEVVAAAARAGYRFAVTTELRGVPAGCDPLALPRVDAWYLRRAGRAGALGTPRGEAFLTLRRAGRRVRSALRRS